MAKFRSAFTLIELMVVVAIIAILSTMGVANFSTAIKRSRNAVRQNDVLAVSKGLEACYDVMRARYLNPTESNLTECHANYESSMANATGVFQADSEGTSTCKNRCLNQDIKPNMKDYNYTAVVGEVKSAEKFVICAKLEQVGNWESIGNSEDDLGSETSVEQAIKKLGPDRKPCKPNSTDCFFCVASSQ